MNGYEKRTLAKKTNILNVAKELFSQKGITDVSITEIAESAGVSRVTLFKYFGDKETLAKEALYDWVNHIIAEYEEILAKNMPYQEKLLMLLNTRLSERESMKKLINTTAWDDLQLRKIINEMIAPHILPMVNSLIDDGKQSGIIDKDIDNEAILVYLKAFSPIVKSPEYIMKGEKFQQSIFDLVMGGLIKNWHNK